MEGFAHAIQFWLGWKDGLFVMIGQTEEGLVQPHIHFTGDQTPGHVNDAISLGGQRSSAD
jgi:hypothetical protein